MIVIPNEVRDLQFRFRLSYRSLVRRHEGIPRYVLSLVAQALLPVRRCHAAMLPILAFASHRIHDKPGVPLFAGSAKGRSLRLSS